jgi:hypothetical protein
VDDVIRNITRECVGDIKNQQKKAVNINREMNHVVHQNPVWITTLYGI